MTPHHDMNNDVTTYRFIVRADFLEAFRDAYIILERDMKKISEGQVEPVRYAKESLHAANMLCHLTKGD